MKKFLLLSLPFFILLFSSAVTNAQTSKDLQIKYGQKFEAFYVRPNILMTVEYKNDGQILEAVIEPRHSTKKEENVRGSVLGDNEMSPKITAEIIDEIVPVAERGQKTGGMTFQSGCSIMESEIYEHVKIYRNYSCSRMNRGEMIIDAAHIYWKR